MAGWCDPRNELWGAIKKRTFFFFKLAIERLAFHEGMLCRVVEASNVFITLISYEPELYSSLRTVE